MKLGPPDLARFAPWTKRAKRLWEFVQAVANQVVEDKLLIRASGLAYTTLLAMVPLTAVVFALFTAFEAFDDVKQRVQGLLLGLLLPSGQEQVTEYLDTFVENARDLSFVGFVVLMATALLLLDNVEWNFNEMWHVEQRRGVISRLTAYTSVLVFGTVLIGLSLIVSARIRAALPEAPDLGLGVFPRLGSWLFPLASSFLAFLLLFLIVPATRVRVRSAAVGAAFTAVTWELGKHLFAASLGQSVRYSTLYGSLAAIPIFLIWLYVTWVLVLTGLEVAYTDQFHSALVRRRRLEVVPVRERLSLGVAMMAEIARRLETGGTPATEPELAERLGRDSDLVREVADRLQGSGLIRRLGAESEETSYVPARSIDRISMVEVVRSVWGGSEPGEGDELVTAIDELVGDFESGGLEALGSLTLRELVERTG